MGKTAAGGGTHRHALMHAWIHTHTHPHTLLLKRPLVTVVVFVEFWCSSGYCSDGVVLSPADPESQRKRTVQNVLDLRQNLEETMSSLRGAQLSHRWDGPLHGLYHSYLPLHGPHPSHCPPHGPYHIHWPSHGPYHSHWPPHGPYHSHALRKPIEWIM